MTNNKQDEKIESEELIKSNKSAAQQVLDQQEEIKELKLQLQNREARIMAIQQLLGEILKNAENESNRFHKEISGGLSSLSDMSKLIQNTVGEQMKTLDEQIMRGAVQATLCDKFRSQEKLPPLNIEK